MQRNFRKRSGTRQLPEIELGRSVKRSDVICAVAESFEEYYEIFEKTCDMSGLLSAYDEMLVNMEKDSLRFRSKG